MAKQESFVHCTCDRCGKEAYLQTTDPKLASDYVEKERITAQDVHEKPLFCKDCLKAYTNFAAEQDTAYRAFINAGGEQ